MRSEWKAKVPCRMRITVSLVPALVLAGSINRRIEKIVIRVSPPPPPLRPDWKFQ